MRSQCISNPRPQRREDRVTRPLLGMGVMVPFLYFGLQVVAAPFYPGYSFVSNVASELGSDHAVYPQLFNAGVLLLGCVTLAAAVGFFRALRHAGVNVFLTYLTSAAVALVGIQSLWAATFPLPDPRHGGHPQFIVAMLLQPFLFAVLLWKESGRAHWLRVCLVVPLILILFLVPFMSGAVRVNIQPYQGVLQRLFALAAFAPLGLGASILAREDKEEK